MDATAQTRGKTNVTVTFRLLDKQGVSNFGLRWRLKELRAEGLQLAATLDKPGQWKVALQGPLEAGFGPSLAKGGGRFHIPFIAMTAGSTAVLKQRHGDPASPERVAEWLRMCLQAWHEGQCDGVVLYCLDKTPGSKVFAPAQKLFREFGDRGH